MKPNATAVLLGAAPQTIASMRGSALAAGIELGTGTLDDGVVDGASAAFIVVGAEPAPALRAIARVHASSPDVPIVALASEKDPDLILRAVRAGARDFLLLDDEAARAASLRELCGARARRGAITALLGASGGVGCTTVAVNLAAELAASNARACVLDLDLHLGSASLLLDLEPRFALSDLVANLDRLDSDLLLSSVPRHACGAWVLGQAGRLDDLDAMDALDVPRLCAFLRRHFDHVLIDGLRGFEDRSLQALDAADRVLVLLTQDLPSVKNARVCVSVLRRLGHEAKVRLVVSRAAGRGGHVALDALPDLVGEKPWATIGADPGTLARAVSRARAVREEAARSSVARDFSQLASLLAGSSPEAARGGLLQSIIGRVAAAASGG